MIANGEDVTEAIRTPEVSEAASRVATNQQVRAALVRKQRELLAERRLGGRGPRHRHRGRARRRGEGLPHRRARDERARRRAEELGTDVETVQRDQALRDAQDAGREHSPLAMAPDAVELDTTGPRPSTRSSSGSSRWSRPRAP